MAPAERPPGLISSNGHYQLPVGEVLVHAIPCSLNPEELKRKANEYLDETRRGGKPDILGLAKLHGRDVVAKVTARGIVLYVGAGIALTAAAIGAVVIHEHSKKK